MTVRWVSKGVATRKVRYRDSHHRAWAADAMDFFHCVNYVIQLFDYVIGVDFTEMVVGKRPRAQVQVMNNVRIRGGGNVQIDCTGQMLASAAQIQNVAL